jgi:hypothetical protein
MTAYYFRVGTSLSAIDNVPAAAQGFKSLREAVEWGETCVDDDLEWSVEWDQDPATPPYPWHKIRKFFGRGPKSLTSFKHACFNYIS